MTCREHASNKWSLYTAKLHCWALLSLRRAALQHSRTEVDQNRRVKRGTNRHLVAFILADTDPLIYELSISEIFDLSIVLPLLYFGFVHEWLFDPLVDQPLTLRCTALVQQTGQWMSSTGVIRWSLEDTVIIECYKALNMLWQWISHYWWCLGTKKKQPEQHMIHF